ncbi:hypothetical protein ACFXI0_07825 [Kitasatospora indigofera]|uniref:hypothetical protein n=1 Tax=Kitasatospora indigofera TaxID=67307 RepID=UPI0036B69885
MLDFLHAIVALEPASHRPTRTWTHRTVQSLLLAEGRWFTPAGLPSQITPLPERDCFANAALTERTHPGLLYAEGFAMPASVPFPVAHAWCVTPDGRVVDPTWTDFAGAAYIGLPIADTRLRPDPLHPNGVLERPETLYPLLRDGVPPGTTAAIGRPCTPKEPAP